MNTLVLQCREERFGHRVIVTDSGAADRLAQPELVEVAGELVGGVVATAIGVEYRGDVEGDVSRGACESGLDMSGVL